jgi:putative PIN family toxin of toxin-antitoxin system
MRVVLDTNILISACWTPGGNEARVIAMAVGGALEIAVSAELEAEYRDVAGRKKFAKQREALEGTIEALLAVASRVEPVAECEACSDADDNQLLDCAVAAGARFVVTGNGKHFPAEWRGVRVINARALLDL